MVGESPSLPGSVQSISANGFSWTSAERPSRADLDDVARSWELLPSDISLALDGRQTPGIFHRERYLLILFPVPLPTDSSHRRSTVSCPVAAFVRPDALLTIHTGQVRALTRFFQQLASDGASRDVVFAAGVGGVLLTLVQRLVDLVAASRARVDHDVAGEEKEISRGAGPEFLVAVTDLQREVRVLRRLVAPWPGLIRGLKDVDLGLAASDDWEHLARRGDHVLAELDDTAEALRGIILAIQVATDIRRAGDVRALIVVTALTLPIIAVTLLLTMPPANPIASLPDEFRATLAIAGAILIGIAVILKRRGIL